MERVVLWNTDDFDIGRQNKLKLRLGNMETRGRRRGRRNPVDAGK